MPDLSQLLIGALGDTGVLQYPDPSLYNAARLLLPSERPPVPVRMQEVIRRPEVEGLYDPDTKDIAVARQGKAYKEFGKRPQRLAAVLAHEGMHAADPDPRHPEGRAYRRQYDVLKRLKEPDRYFMDKMKLAAEMNERSDREAGITPLQAAFGR